MAERDDLVDQAIAWHLRLPDADDAQWEAFVAWLEASPEHSEAYEAIAMMDRGIEASPALAATGLPRVGNDNHRSFRVTRTGAGAGALLAASLALAIALPMMTTREAPYEITTPDGQARTITLSDSTVVHLSGGTRMAFDRHNPRVATLISGDALFDVRHDARLPFIVTAGDVRLRDLGTTFSVSRASDRVLVAVAEGSVEARHDGGPETLVPGDAIDVRADGSGAVRSKVAPESVGGWRKGTLSFTGEPLGAVTATLNRLYAFRISLGANLSGRPFTGMIHLTGAADRDVPHVAALTGTSWRRNGTGWILSERPAPLH